MEEPIEKQLEECLQTFEKITKERDDYLAGWQRAKADFENYRKEEHARVESYIAFANEALIREIITVLDSFDLAVNAFDAKAQESHLFKGMILIRSQLEAALEKFGVKALHAVGEKFNPQLHEALLEIESQEASGTVIEEIEKGYTMHNKLLRPAKVKIAK